MTTGDARELLEELYPDRWALALIAVERRGKVPLKPDWNGTAAERWRNGADRSAHLERAAGRLAKGGNLGLALPPGVVAPDADTPEAVAWLDTALPDAPTQRTAKGAHFLARVPESAEIRATVGVEIAAGIRIDVRAGGRSQIVAAPSTHETGCIYTWLRELPKAVEELPECPALILEKITASPAPAPTPDAAEASIPAGQRNDTLARIAGKLRRDGLDGAELDAALQEINRRRCDPPLTSPEVATIAQSIGRYPAGNGAEPEEPDLSALLAKLPELEYQQRRAELAKGAGIGLGALDAVRKDARKAARSKVNARDTQEPWPELVEGEQLAASVEAALRRFVVLSKHAYVLVTIWAIGTHAYASRNVWPLLLARSPQPACGKSTLLDLLERLVAQPFVAGNASLATLFRSSAFGPTQLLDELDRWVERDPEVIGFLCAGWQSGRPFVRCHPETHELQEFPCYGPKALALIGDVQDEALRSRCVVVEMRRALPGERSERFRASRPYPDLAELRAKAARWAADHLGAIAAYEMGEDELSGLSGREADNAEALLAVAESIDGAWPERCREALLAAPVEESQDLGAILLADLAALLDTMPRVEAVSTACVIKHLNSLDDRPWPTWGKHEKGFTAHALRRCLAPFGIRPARHSIAGAQVRGYLVAPIREAAERYLPPSSGPPEQVSEVSNRLEGPPSDALRAPGTPLIRQIDTLDTSQAGLEKGGIPAPLDPDSDDDTLGGLFS